MQGGAADKAVRNFIKISIKGFLVSDKDIKQKMREFISKYTKDDISDDRNYFAAGLISSIIAVQMILYIESHFKIKVEDEDLVLSNFSSLNAIEKFVTRKHDFNCS